MRRFTGSWWLWLVVGIAWIVVSVVLLQFDLASVTPVGILVGRMFTFAGITNIALAALSREVLEATHWFSAWRCIFIPAFVFPIFLHRHLVAIAENPRIRPFLLGVTAGVVGLIASVTSRSSRPAWPTSTERSSPRRRLSSCTASTASWPFCTSFCAAARLGRCYRQRSSERHEARLEQDFALDLPLRKPYRGSRPSRRGSIARTRVP